MQAGRRGKGLDCESQTKESANVNRAWKWVLSGTVATALALAAPALSLSAEGGQRGAGMRQARHNGGNPMGRGPMGWKAAQPSEAQVGGGGACQMDRVREQARDGSCQGAVCGMAGQGDQTGNPALENSGQAACPQASAPRANRGQTDQGANARGGSRDRERARDRRRDGSRGLGRGMNRDMAGCPMQGATPGPGAGKGCMRRAGMMFGMQGAGPGAGAGKGCMQRPGMMRGMRGLGMTRGGNGMGMGHKAAGCCGCCCCGGCR